MSDATSAVSVQQAVAKKCFHCNGPHFKRDCPKLRPLAFVGDRQKEPDVKRHKPNESVPLTGKCFHCQGSHFKRECPLLIPHPFTLPIGDSAREEAKDEKKHTLVSEEKSSSPPTAALPLKCFQCQGSHLKRPTLALFTWHCLSFLRAWKLSIRCHLSLSTRGGPDIQCGFNI
jgi:hypothetical protein